MPQPKRSLLAGTIKFFQINRWIFDWTETIVVAFILALVVRAFFLQVFWIPSGSMEPTLDIGARIMVDKVSYNFRPPKRFEVMVFRGVPSKYEEMNEKRDLIKRVIGLPGEKLQIKKGVICINDAPIAEAHPMNRDYAEFGPLAIPPDSYFMMGDNRPASSDSRFWGVLPKKNIIGRALFCIWPLSRINIIP